MTRRDGPSRHARNGRLPAQPLEPGAGLVLAGIEHGGLGPESALRAAHRDVPAAELPLLAAGQPVQRMTFRHDASPPARCAVQACGRWFSPVRS